VKLLPRPCKHFLRKSALQPFGKSFPEVIDPHVSGQTLDHGGRASRLIPGTFALQRTRQPIMPDGDDAPASISRTHAGFHGLFHIRNLHRVDGL